MGLYSGLVVGTVIVALQRNLVIANMDCNNASDFLKYSTVGWVSIMVLQQQQQQTWWKATATGFQLPTVALPQPAPSVIMPSTFYLLQKMV